MKILDRLSQISLVVVPVLALAASGCMVEGTGDDSSDGTSALDGPSGPSGATGGAVDPNAQYVPEQDPAKA